MTTVRCRSLGEFQRALARDVTAFERGLRSALRKTANRGARVIQKEAPVDLGGLRNSITAVHTPATSYIRVSSPITKIILRGSRPHMPPVEPLIGWVTRRGFASGVEAEKLAWAIARHIAQHGTRPNPFIDRAMPRVHEIADVEIRRVRL